MGSIVFKVDPSSSELYVSIKLNTGAFSYSGYELVYFKLTTSFAVSWFRRVHGLSSNPSYEILDSIVGTSNFW